MDGFFHGQLASRLPFGTGSSRLFLSRSSNNKTRFFVDALVSLELPVEFSFHHLAETSEDFGTLKGHSSGSIHPPGRNARPSVAGNGGNARITPIGSRSSEGSNDLFAS
jgi:hypothetical protein